MGERGSTKKERRNPNDPARFLGSIAVTDDGEKQMYITILIQTK